MATIFSRIASGEIPSYKIAEDENYFAFLDISPMAVGHTLVIPKKETDYLFDMEDTDLSGLILFAKKTAKAIKEAIPCRKVGLMVIGLEVAHAHIHLIPMESEKVINITNPKLKLSPEKFTETAEAIKKFID